MSIQMNEGHIHDCPQTRKKFNIVMEVCNRPEKLFEIGFQGGHSTRMLLDMFPDMKIHSIDICEYDYTERLGNELAEENENFTFQNISSFDLTVDDLQGYDAVFVDGGHDELSVENDIQLCIDANIRYIIVDDYKKNFKEIVNITNNKVRSNNYHWFGDKIPYICMDKKRQILNTLRIIVRSDLIPTYPEKVQKLFTKE